MVALVSSCVEAVSFIVTSFAAAVGVVSAKLYSCVVLPQACGFKPSRYEPPCRSQRRSFSSGMAPSLFVLRSATQSRLISFRNCWRRGVSEPLTLPVGRGGVRVDRSDAIARRWLRVHCGINVRSKIDNAADLERDWGSRIREQLALPSYSEATTAGQLFWSRGGPGCIPSLRLKHTSTPARVQHPLRTRGQQPLHEALHTSIGRVFVTTRAMVLRVERQGADSRSPALYLISIDILKPHVLVF